MDQPRLSIRTIISGETLGTVTVELTLAR